MKRICVIGQLPPPIHGLSKALDTILKSEYMNSKFKLSSIDIKDNRKFYRHLFLIRQQQSDIYYFNLSNSKFGNLRDMVILFSLLNKKKKVIVHYHSGYYDKLYKSMNSIQKWINRKLISNIHFMIVLSESLRNLFQDVIEPKKIRICENGIEDESLINDQQFEHKLKVLVSDKKELEVLYLSNFIKSKGYEDLLHAATHFKDKQVRFHFAGKFFAESDKQSFFKFIADHQLESRVEYHGVVAGKEKLRLLEISDVFALPTYYHSEGQPISIMEALGNGLAIISTKHSGIPDLVCEKNGYLINPQSPLEIIGAITDLLVNRERLINFAIENRKTALTKYKEIDYIQRLEFIFNEVFIEGRDENEKSNAVGFVQPR